MSESPSPAAPRPAVPESGNSDREFPITHARFEALHLHRSHDHVFCRLLKVRHGGQARTASEWKALLEKLRNEPAYK